MIDPLPEDMERAHQVDSRLPVLPANLEIDQLAQGVSFQMVEAFDSAAPSALAGLSDDGFEFALRQVEIRTRAYLRRVLTTQAQNPRSIHTTHSQRTR